MKKYIHLFVILTMVFSSCETEEPIPTYTLSTSVSPTEGGKITVSPQSLNYKEGDVVTLTPEPNEHWVFQKWDGDGSGSSTPLQITMNSNKSVVGVFVKRDYPLNLTIEGEGTVEEKIVTNPSGREYPHGTTVELTPVPKEGWVFDSWGGDLSGTETPKNITVDKEKNVTVKFKRKDYKINFTIIGEGSVEEKIVSTPSGRVYPFQTVVELTPVPKEGWVFESWDGDLTGTDSPKNLTIDKDRNVTVVFRQPIFRLGDNGITCICENVKVGEKGFINGVEYEVVDNSLLRKRRDEGVDMTKLCTSLVTNMNSLFDSFSFNQPIGNWDVSNVIDMRAMFANTQFNQPIGNWNVSKVTDMEVMFTNSKFNQPIGDWDVGNVTRMNNMFTVSPFNQPIGDWDVSKVTSMRWMFGHTPFNQPIGDWDVSNVTEMWAMFSDNSQFNQNISKWCVINITSEPANFSFKSPLTSENKPRWGTCPDN